MSTKFGTIALYKTDKRKIMDLCELLEQENWFSDYIILSGVKGWNTIYDENLEWGNIDIYVKLISSQIKTTILSVEYDDNQVRYRVWKSGELLSEKSIGHMGTSLKGNRLINRIFSDELQIKYSLISKIFIVQEAEQSVRLMESVLQCQLWRWEESVENNKIVTGEFYPISYFDEFFKQKNSEQMNYGSDIKENFIVEKAIKAKGILHEFSSEYPVLFNKEDDKGVFYLFNCSGEIHQELSVSLKILAQNFAQKTYAGKGKIGFLTKEEGFVLYERNEKISSFPDINGYGLGKWHAFMPDDYTIFMNWACYDIKSGKKKWDFPLPVQKKSWKQFLQQEMWQELPNDMFVMQVNVDQKTLYLILMDRNGYIEKNLSLKISYLYYRVGVGKKYIYMMRRIEGNPNLIEVVLFDFELNEKGRYRFKFDSKYYGLHFDSESKYFYVISEQKIVRVYIANHEKEEFSLPILRNQIWINTWRILEEDVLLIVLNDAELLMLDTKKDLECVFYHKLKGLYLADYSLENGEVLILSQSKKADGYVVTQKIIRGMNKIGRK
ncbi:hypothetical protein [Clostridium sp. AN503]|uniref:hypothetical protein n=1 Tax=Clostridium sp. AN503 TaxID=3160598 RepID=UPI003458F1FC